MDKKKLVSLKGAKIPSGEYTPVTQPVVQSAVVNLGLVQQGAATVTNPANNVYYEWDFTSWDTNRVLTDETEWRVGEMSWMHSDWDTYIPASWKKNALGWMDFGCGRGGTSGGARCGPIINGTQCWGTYAWGGIAGTRPDEQNVVGFRLWAQCSFSNDVSSDGFDFACCDNPDGDENINVSITRDASSVYLIRHFRPGGSGYQDYVPTTTVGTGTATIHAQFNNETGADNAFRMRADSGHVAQAWSGDGRDSTGFTLDNNSYSITSAIYDPATVTQGLGIFTGSANTGSVPNKQYKIFIEYRIAGNDWQYLTS